MHDLRPVRSDQCSHVVIGRLTPNRAGGHPQSAKRVDRIIVQAVLNHVVPVHPEHGDFGCNTLILAAGLLVEVVGDEETHCVGQFQLLLVNGHLTDTKDTAAK